MAKVIVSGGCSFAYGFNLKNRDSRYASLLADHYDTDLIDVSGTAKSNETIAASISYGLNQAIKKYNPQDIVVLVGWTETARMEYWDKRCADFQAFFSHGFVPRWRTPAEVLRLTVISDFFMDKLWDPCYSYYKLLHAFNYVHNICLANKVRVIHLKNLNIIKAQMPSHERKHCDTLRLVNYTEDIFSLETAKAFDRMYEMDSFTDLISKDPKKYYILPGTDHHPNELGHLMWMENINQTYGKIIP